MSATGRRDSPAMTRVGVLLLLFVLGVFSLPLVGAAVGVGCAVLALVLFFLLLSGISGA